MSSALSGKAGRLASIWTATYLQDQQKGIDDRIKQGQELSLGALGKGYDAARSSYGDAMGLFTPYVESGRKALGVYGDAIGLNGDEGYARSVGLYHRSPGFEGRVAEATDAVARKQSALGALGSGNTMQAISDRANYLADQDYGQWLDRVKGQQDLGYNATGQVAGLTKGIGDLYGQQGRDEAGVYGDSTRLGVLGQQNTTQGIANAVQGGMMAGQQASANRWGLGMSLANLGAGLLGRAFA